MANCSNDNNGIIVGVTSAYMWCIFKIKISCKKEQQQQHTQEQTRFYITMMITIKVYTCLSFSVFLCNKMRVKSVYNVPEVNWVKSKSQVGIKEMTIIILYAICMWVALLFIFLNVLDHVAIHYRTIGRPKSDPVVFLPNWLATVMAALDHIVCLRLRLKLV